MEEAGSANPGMKIEFASIFLAKAVPVCSVFTLNLWQNSDCDCLLIEGGKTQPRAFPEWENSFGADFNCSIGHGDKQEGGTRRVLSHFCAPIIC